MQIKACQIPRLVQENTLWAISCATIISEPNPLLNHSALVVQTDWLLSKKYVEVKKQKSKKNNNLIVMTPQVLSNRIFWAVHVKLKCLYSQLVCKLN